MSSISARSAILNKTGSPFVHTEVALPTPAVGELIVEIEMCTICGSDLHTIEGRRPFAGPMVLGHEIIGRVVQLPASPVGDVVGEALNIGDRVTWSLHAACGDCFFCINGLSQKCEQLFKYGHEPVTEALPCTGGFASHCQLRPGTAIVRIPDSLAAEVACPANCATATVAAAFRQVDDCHGKCVFILGAGMLGLTATAWAKELGAASVVVVDPNESRAKLAVKFGATSVVTSLPQAQEELLSLTNCRGADLSFDFSGNNEAVLAAIHFLRVGGEVVLVGSVFPTESISISPEKIVRGWIRIHGVHNYLGEDLVRAVEFLTTSGQKYPFEALIGANFMLSDLQAAIDLSASGESVRIAIING